MEPDLSLDDLRARTDVGSELLRDCGEAGLVGSADDPSRFERLDVERLNLVSFLLRRGFTLDQIRKAEQDEGFLSDGAGELAQLSGWPDVRLSEVAERTSTDIAFLQRIRDAGLAGDGDLLTQEDAELLDGLGLVVEAGVTGDELVEMVKVYSDALGRVAEAEVRLFHFYVHERLRARGLSGDKLRAASNEAGERLQTLVEPAVLYFHRRGMARALREDLVLHLAAAIGTLAPTQYDAQLSVAVVFVDLASFTALTDTMGDAAAAAVLERFSDLVRTAVVHHDGTLVKQIGDAFMLVFGSASDAVRCGLEIDDLAIQERRFLGTRVGAHWGPALYRGGDYVGATVNLAARITAEAQPHQMLVTAALQTAATDVEGVELRALKSRSLKGVADDIELFEARHESADTTDRVVDPVCGMELTGSDIVVRLTDEGDDKAFCSTDCLQRYLALARPNSPDATPHH